jgi:hypothetical protein
MRQGRFLNSGETVLCISLSPGAPPQKPGWFNEGETMLALRCATTGPWIGLLPDLFRSYAAGKRGAGKRAAAVAGGRVSRWAQIVAAARRPQIPSQVGATMNTRSVLTALDDAIVRCTLETEDTDVDLDRISLSLDTPSKFELVKARAKNPAAMKLLDDYVEANNSRKAYRRANCGFAAFPIED